MVPFDLFSWITRIALHAATTDILSEMLLLATSMAGMFPLKVLKGILAD